MNVRCYIPDCRFVNQEVKVNNEALYCAFCGTPYWELELKQAKEADLKRGQGYTKRQAQIEMRDKYFCNMALFFLMPLSILAISLIFLFRRDFSTLELCLLVIFTFGGLFFINWRANRKFLSG